MNRHTLWTSLFLVIVSLVLAGCLKKDDDVSLEDAKPVSSAHFAQDAILDTALHDEQDNPRHLIIEGDFVVNESGSSSGVNMQLEASWTFGNNDSITDEVKVLQVDGKAWIQCPPQQCPPGWNEVDLGWWPSHADGPTHDPTFAFQYPKFAANVKRLQDSQVDGLDCYHYSFVIHTDDLDIPMGRLGGASVEEMYVMDTFEGEAWISKEDLFLRRVVIGFDSESKSYPRTPPSFKFSVDTRFSKINEPVEIGAP